MPSPAQVAAGRAAAPTRDYASDLDSGVLQTRTPGAAGASVPVVRGFIGPTGWDANYKAAIATVLFHPVTVAVIGASFEVRTGTGTTDLYSTNMWPVYAKGLLAKYAAQRYGDFFWVGYNVGLGAGSAPNGHPIVYDLAPTSLVNVGPVPFVGAWTALNNNPNPLLHYSHLSSELGYSNLSGDIIYFDPATGSGQSFTWNLNGGAAQTVNLTGSGTMKRVSWNQNTAGWVNGVNVVNVMTQTLANIALIIGFSAYPGANGPGTSGIGFAWLAQPATCLHDYGRTDQNPTLYAGAMATVGRIDKWAFLAGCQNTGAANPPYTPNTFGFPFNINLLMLGVCDDWIFYDSATDNTLTTVGGQIGTWIGGLAYDHRGAPAGLFREYLWKLSRAIQSTLGSILYSIGPIQSGYYSDVNTVGYPPQNFSAWRDQYIASAMGDTNGYWDVSNDVQEYGVARGFQLAGDPHFVDAGDAYRAAVALALT